MRLSMLRRNQQHEVQVQRGSSKGPPVVLRTLQQRIDQLQREIMQCNRSARLFMGPVQAVLGEILGG